MDSLANKKGLCGLGPESFLKGEILIKHGQVFVARAISDSTMSVQKISEVIAPFFVHSNVSNWKEIDLPSGIKNIKNLKEFIDENSQNISEPFTFCLACRVRQQL